MRLKNSFKKNGRKNADKKKAGIGIFYLNANKNMSDKKSKAIVKVKDDKNSRKRLLLSKLLRALKVYIQKD